MTVEETVNSYRQYVKKIMDFNEAIALAEWDMRTGAPVKGISQRSEVVGTLSDEVFKRSISDEMKTYLDVLTDSSVQDKLDRVTRRMVEESRKTFNRFEHIPAEEYKAYVILQSEAQSVWQEAKAKSDFRQLQPYLEKIVDFKRKFIEYQGVKENKYNTLLDLYEPGLTTEIVDGVFKRLREGIVPIVQSVCASKDQPETGFLHNHLPADKLKAFCLHLLKENGYDFNAGRLDETEHPFEITLNPGDVRVTTNYQEDDFMSTVLGTIHEGGHALYEQHISRELVGTSLCEGTSMGIHESQSLFFENFIGRSKAYWALHFSELKKFASGQFDSVSLDDFYRAINVSHPSLIRTLADELTYPLHIMVRYDIEKELFNGNLEVSELPGVWNDKMKEYLGIMPDNDREGVLQDIHWPGGDFGYFPSYALGYVYAAQFKHAILKEHPDFDDLVSEGHLSVITKWLTMHIHRFGSLKKPFEILHDATGEGPNPEYLISYLSDKYSRIYNF
ncbi:carboxypeptidase M32 [Sporolactobacillus sp. THM19-2]|uniref:carboxypeptidase M32 n=1 Tax=Sporolactobacillus sp. THM19-2 TaxID=2511171 RepID=UPI001020F8F5|nr:carboxypeptidase M32 [Sporolactobacillus sp. THM19-2]RYL93343.1 carboxypeptidase M32 [Sporolactobacillus sp. THM19-2]